MFANCALVLMVLGGADPGIDDLRQGVMDREAAIRGFKLSCQINTFLRSTDGKKISLSGLEHVTASADVGGRIRYESSGSVREERGDRQEAVLGAFDGNQARSMQTRGTDRFVVAVIDRTRSAVSFRLDPSEFVNQFFNEPVSNVLQRPNLIAVGKEAWDGRDAQVLETDYDPPEQGVDYRKVRFWIDPSRGFAVVKRAALARRSPEQEWAEYYRAEGFDHREIDAGLWLPMRVVVETANVTDKQIEQGTVLASYKVQVQEWELNPKFANSEFRLAFPAGVNVTDRISGRSFQAGAITDQLLADQLSMEESDGRGWGFARARWLFVSANAVVVIAVALLLIFRRKGCAG